MSLEREQLKIYMSRASPWTCSNISSEGYMSWTSPQMFSKTNGWRLHSSGKSSNEDSAYTWLYLHATPSNNSKWRLHVSVDYDAMSSSPLFHTTNIDENIKGTDMEASDQEASDHCSVCLSCFDSFIWVLGAWIKKKQEKYAVFKWVSGVSCVYVMMFSGSV